MSRATLEPLVGPDDRDGFLVTTPYSERFIEALKQLPIPDRRWFADSKGWWTAAEHEEWVRALLLQYFGGYAMVDEDGATIESDDGERVRQGGLF